MATTSNSEAVSKDIVFDASGGLFGASSEGLNWDAFLGIGGKEPVKAPINLGGAVDAWIPFVGDTEVLKLQLLGEIATRIGLALNFELSPGTTTATLPYDVSYSFPDTQTLAANPFFRLEGSGLYDDTAAAGFETDWPYLLFSIDAIFELAVLMEMVAGLLGDNDTYKLLDFDVGVEVPIVDLDTRPGNSPELFGFDFGELASISGSLSGPGAYIENPTSFEASFSGSDIDLLVGEAEDDSTGRKDGASGNKDEDTDPSVTQQDDKKPNSILDQVEIGAGSLATLTLNIPNIELADRDAAENPSGGTHGLFDPITYSDGTRAGDFDGTYDDPENPVLVQDLASLNIDLDNIAVEALKRAFTGGVGVPNTPGLEGSVSLDLGSDLFGAGAYFDYNLIDTDLVFSLPIEQTITVAPDVLQTALSFYRADASGTVIETGGVKEALFLEARLPRYSVYFNESNTFWNDDVAAMLQELMQTNAAAAEDIALFVDLTGGKIPGAFTGKTNSISGGVVMRENGTGPWVQLTTNAEQTEFLARTRPGVGQDPQLDDIQPRNNAEFKYVIYDADTAVNGAGEVNLGSALGHVDLDFATYVGEDGIFEAVLDIVTAPTASTGLTEGVPSLDLYFPDLSGDSVWVDVSHRAGAEVTNDTSLDFNLDLVMSALEVNFGAYLKALGARFGLDFSFGPLWEKSYPLFSAELAKLYDGSFGISDTTFDSGTETDQSSWGFALGAGGSQPNFATAGTSGDDLFDGAPILGGATVDGSAGTDTITFNNLPAGQSATFDLGKAEASSGHVAGLNGWTQSSFNPFAPSLEFSSDLSPIGLDASLAFEVTHPGGAGGLVNLQLITTALRTSGPSLYAGQETLDMGSGITLAAGETAYVWLDFLGDEMQLFASTSPTKPASPLDTQTMSFATDASRMNLQIQPQSGHPATEIRNLSLEQVGNTPTDFADFVAAGAFVNNGGSITTETFAPHVTSIENLAGSREADDLRGDAGANRIEGGEGDDTLNGLGGADTIIGGLGQDVLIGGGTTSGRDEVYGGEGDDRIIAGSGAALFDGGEDAPVGTSGGSPADLDIVDYRAAPGAISINLDSGSHTGPWVGGHELANIEGIAATDYDDTLTGDNGRSYFEAGAGDDMLAGDNLGVGLTRAEKLSLTGDNDRLYGQDGNDTLKGGPGADMLDGGAGTDLVDYSEAPTSVFVDMADGETIDGTEFAPLLQGTGSEPIESWRIDGQGWRGWAQGDKLRDIENLDGSDYDDILFGDAGANVINGGLGDDRITGRAGADTINGEAGDDILWTAAQHDFYINRAVDGNHTSQTVRAPVNTTLDARFTIPTLDLDVLDGGAGEDFAILDWTGPVTVDEDNLYYRTDYTNTREYTTFYQPFWPFGPLTRVTGIDQSSSTRNYELDLRYEIRDLVRAVGNLETGEAALEITPDRVSVADDLWNTHYRTSGGWVERADALNAHDYYNNAYVRNTETINVYSSRNSYNEVVKGTYYANFQHEVTNILMPEATTITYADLTGLEGLIGSIHDDMLIGSATDNSLYGAGGADIITAADGDDVVSFGEGQSPQQLFSFPGRGYANVTAFSPAGVADSGQTDTASDADHVISGTGNPNGGTPSGTNYTVKPYDHAPWATLIDSYLAGPRDSTSLEALQTSLANFSNFATYTIPREFNDFSFIDGNAGEDTLDLRFDRGLSFLPASGAMAANVYLEDFYAEIGTQNGHNFDEEAQAILFGIENIIGTAQNDNLNGTTGDNVIEGGGGADTMRGGGGIDVLAYDNADASVSLVLQTDGTSTKARAGNGGDAASDYFTGFEVMRGSRFGDRIGQLEDDAAGTSGNGLANNAIQVFDAGDGNDILVAGRTGASFEGGDGDDRFVIGSGDALAGAAGGGITLKGGAGTDQARLTGTVNSLTETATGWDVSFTHEGAAAPETLTLEGIEYLRVGGQDIALANTDPVVSAPGSIDVAEDPWSPIQVFAAESGRRVPTQEGTVTSLPDTGTFMVGATPVAVGDILTSTDLEALSFIPNQLFGIPQGGIRQGATLGITHTVDVNGSPVAQPREIVVPAGDLDGAALGLADPTDTVQAAVGYDFGEIAVEEGLIGPSVHLGAIGFAYTADYLNIISGGVTPEREDAVISEFSRSLSQSLPQAQSYEITELSEGTLWLTSGPVSDPVKLKPLSVGDVVTAGELNQLLFEKDGGLVTTDDTITFRPLETLTVEITDTPTSGFIFSPVSDLGLSLPIPVETVTLNTTPDNGTLFYRAADGSRVDVAAGDSLTEGQVQSLHFEAAVTRRATLSDTAELAADVAALNALTIAAGNPGEGASAVPTDPSALNLSFQTSTSAPTIDGVSLDLEAVGSDYAIFITGDAPQYDPPRSHVSDPPPFGLDTPVQWTQWKLEDGGNGHFYAFGSLDTTDSAYNISSVIGIWNGTAINSDHSWINQSPIALASVGSAAENDFIYSLVGDNPNAWSGANGARLGGQQSGGTWGWSDGTPWDVEIWKTGEPNNSGGSETTLHYGRTVVDFDLGLYLPTWNDISASYDAPGFIVEITTTTTQGNDSVRGSASDDLIDGAGGDDILQGLDGNDSIRGGLGDDQIDGGLGDDTITGGAGADTYIMKRKAGTDTITDFDVAADKIDISQMGLSALSEIRAFDGPQGVELHAKETTLILEGVSAAELTLSQFAGVPIHAAASIADAPDRALSAGDTIHADELAGLRFRAPDDFNGAAGTLGYEVRDPWANDIMDASRDGKSASTLDINVTPVADAPRLADATYLVSAGSTLDATDPLIKLNPSDPDGDPVTVSLVTGPTNGTLTLSPDGAFTYTPTPGFVGDPDITADDSFTVAATDGSNVTEATISLDIADTAAERKAAASQAPDDNGFLRLGGLTADDNLGGGANPDHINGGFGNDWIKGRGDDDSLEGGAGDDTITGDGGNDTISGGDGNDSLNGGTGIDEIDGGNGDDTIDASFGDDAVVSGGAGNDNITGGGGSDSITGGDDNDTITGDANDDTISGDAGNDRLFGQIGRDSLSGGDGDDYISGANAADTIDGGAGNDTLLGQGSSDSIEGGSGDDSLNGGASADTLSGGDGDDTADGGAFNDVVIGGAGNDSLLGGSGNDSLSGGADDDTLDGGSGSDLLAGEDGNDSLMGGIGQDTLLGGAGDDRLFGGNANDFISGGAGADTIDGGTGSDLIQIASGEGGDQITGGAGADTFDFETGFITATITDFAIGQDTIDLVDVAAATAFADLTITAAGGDTTIDLGGGDSIILQGVSGTLTDSDFLF